jgi:hypothetical protein
MYRVLGGEMSRALTRDELEAMDLTPNQVEEILNKQNKKRERKFRYIVMLTTSEAEELSKREGKKFIRATEWKGKWETREVKTKQIKTT